jgi:hypothetical protein
MKAHSAKPFVTFHLAVGTRLALRKLAPILAVAFAAYYLLRPELFNAVFAALLERGSFLMGLVSSMLSLSVAAMAAPRICLGLNGWIRHLPARGLTHRRLAGIAIALSQIPILLVLATLAFIAFKVYKVSPFLYLSGLPILGLAAGLCVLPVKHNYLSKPLTFAACLLSTSGHWLLLIGAILLVITADITAGPLSRTRKSAKSQKSISVSFISTAIAFRALRLRTLLAYIPPLFILGMTSLFLSNNTLTPLQVSRGVIFGGTLSIATFYAFAANLLAVRRPPWPWGRSLPWSASHRILTDTVLIGVLTLPLIVLISFIHSSALWPIIVSLLPLAAFSALMIRTAFLYPMGALGRTFITGTVASVLMCLLPALSFIFLASTPVILKFAAAGEKNQKVSAWLEMHHLAAGDSLSWSRQ